MHGKDESKDGMVEKSRAKREVSSDEKQLVSALFCCFVKMFHFLHSFLTYSNSFRKKSTAWNSSVNHCRCTVDHDRS